MKLTAESTVFNDDKVQEKFAELIVDADSIRTEVGKKVGNNEVISRINQSAESIKIQADKVNIEGATIFTSGRLSQNSLNNAYDANGSATSAVNGLKTDLSSSSGTTVINGGHISTGTLSAGAVDANSGTFNTANIPNLNASKITAGTLSADRIGAGTLSVGKIDASSGTFNTANIPNLSANKITSDTLNADRIGTNTIDASKLTVGVQADINSNRRNYARLLSRVGTSSTASGVTTSVATDFAISANGTATATAYALNTSVLVDVTLDAGSYVIWCTSSTLNHLRLGQGPSSTWLAEPRPTKAEPYKLTLNASTRITVGLIYDKGTTYNNVKTYLMIEKGDTASDWVPAIEDTRVGSYVTQINGSGIRIHPYSTGNNSVVINADGMEVFKGGTTDAYSVAKYGDTARVGKAAEGHVTISSSGMDIDATSSVSIGHLGYTSGKNSTGGTSTAPYYTLGYRSTSNIIGNYSVAEGYSTSATSYCSHAEGYNTTASANYSHAEGYNSKASNTYAHAEGYGNTASGVNSHAEGGSTTASGSEAHAEGSFTTASGDDSHASGVSTIAQGYAQTVIGSYNVAQGTADSHTNTDNLFIVGNGSGGRSNALALTWAGKMTIASTLTQNSDRRLKEHLNYLDDSADDFIRSLKPAHYIKDDEHHLGFYAQDVAEVDEWDCMTGEMNGYLTLGYTEIIAPLVAYCQHLEKRISELESERK